MKQPEGIFKGKMTKNFTEPWALARGSLGDSSPEEETLSPGFGSV